MALQLLDIILALLIGLSTGIVLQRGRICAITAFRNLLVIRNSGLSSNLIITILVELLGYQIIEILPGSSSTPIQID